VGSLVINAVGEQVNGTFSSSSAGRLVFAGSGVYLGPSTLLTGSGVLRLTNYVHLVLT
jgi:hypothetical protein